MAFVCFLKLCPGDSSRKDETHRKPMMSGHKWCHSNFHFGDVVGHDTADATWKWKGWRHKGLNMSDVTRNIKPLRSQAIKDVGDVIGNTKPVTSQEIKHTSVVTRNMTPIMSQGILNRWDHKQWNTRMMSQATWFCYVMGNMTQVTS